MAVTMYSVVISLRCMCVYFHAVLDNYLKSSCLYYAHCHSQIEATIYLRFSKTTTSFVRRLLEEKN